VAHKRYQSVRERAIAQARNWQKSHPERFKELRKKAFKENPISRIKKGHGIKGSGAILKTHLESLFVSPMSWDNYGSVWEIQHLKTRQECDFQSLNYNDALNIAPKLRV
jgi:hypothetical protein